jgi:sugar phosphate isomerase/epimerase
MEKAISTLLFERLLRVSDILDIKKAGIKSLELIYNFTEIPSRTMNSMKNSNMRVYSIHADFNSDISDIKENRRIESIEGIKKTIDIIKKINGELVVLHPGDSFNNSYEREVRVNNSINSLTEIVEYALLNNIRIAVENDFSDFELNRLGDSIEEIDYIINKVKSLSGCNGTIGICVDTGHAFLTNNLYDYLDFFKSNIFEIHIHDNLGVRNKNRIVSSDDLHLVPGMGKIDWKTFFNKLEENNYKGAHVFEISTCYLEVKCTKYVLEEIGKFIKRNDYFSQK